jgi:hypothetical protein
MAGGEVKLPGLGQVKTKYLAGGVIVVLVIVGVAYYRNRNAASSAAAGAETTATADNSATDSIDPQTGYPYGSAEDTAALEQLSASGSSDLDYGDGEYYSALPTDTVATAPNTGPGTFTDNAYWLQYAEQNVTGYSATQIQGALSAYLAGMKLTTTQYSIYQAAVGVAGPPPNAPATPTAPTSGGSGGSGTGGGAGGGHTAISGQVTGLSAAAASPTSVKLTWEKADGATGYRVDVYDRGTTTVKESENVTGTTATVSGLAKKARYEFYVTALPGTGHSTTYATTS